MTVCTCRQWRQFSCVTDTQCREWNNGERCCQGGQCCYQEEDEVTGELAEEVIEEVTEEVSEEVSEEVFEEVTEDSTAEVKEDLSVNTNNTNVIEKFIETQNEKETIIINATEEVTSNVNVNENKITAQTMRNENELEEKKIKGKDQNLMDNSYCIL